MSVQDPVREPPLRTPSPIDGVWRNQLGSELILETDGRGGLTGTFRSGTAAGALTPIKGSYDPSPKHSGTALGFMVDWTEVHSVTVWSGQHDGGEDLIRATWLMTVGTSADREWQSTVIGHDVFERQPRR